MEAPTRFDITFEWVDTIPFSELTAYAFAGTLERSITLNTPSGKRFENYHDGTPYYTAYNSGMWYIENILKFR